MNFQRPLQKHLEGVDNVDGLPLCTILGLLRKFFKNLTFFLDFFQQKYNTQIIIYVF